MTTPKPTPERTGEAKVNPFPFPLVVVEREADGSLYFLCTQSGKLEGTHKYFWCFDIACDKREAEFMAHAVNSHATLTARASLADQLAEALEAIPPCDVAMDASFVYKTSGWKWADAMEKRNTALAAYRAASASGKERGT